ncbi:rRNA processing [Ascochyta rabiei]|uniref:rRNA processing n=1 Tax=Didymella rabiei TaxID=5454 RepID=A0A163KG86_DIDRA|nr:rRNA processing [Ascochyta rabiei]
MAGLHAHHPPAAGPAPKRQRVHGDQHPASAPLVRHSTIFAPFRTVGLVSPTAVPFTALPLGKTTFQITTSVGRSLQTYDLKRGLNLVFVTRPQTPDHITATLAWKKLVLAAWGSAPAESGVWLFQRGKKLAELELPPGGIDTITRLAVMGEWIVGGGPTRVDVWKTATLEHYTTLQGPASSRLSGCITNMPTYLNKIFVGTQDGTVEIWNVSTGKLLYTLLPPAADFGAVTALQPTPALSLLAIAYQSGPVVIHDIRADREALRLNTAGSQKPPVTSISFRTDGLGAGEHGRDDGVMATASHESGDVTFWDLNKGGRKMGTLRGAHAPPPSASGGLGGGISKIEFLAGQAVMVSSGLDNTLKSWIFDESPFSPVPRILHQRGGHAAPVSTLRFLPSNADGSDDTGKWLLSASKDRSLWGWSLRRDGQSTELSQGALQSKARKRGLLHGSSDPSKHHVKWEHLKAPPVTCMACSLNRDGGMGTMPGVNAIWTNASKLKGDAKKATEVNMTGWESIVTGHGDKTARTWFWGRKRAGRWALDTGDGTDVKSVAISPCARLTPAEAKKHKLHQLRLEESTALETDDAPKTFARGQGKHRGAVTGLAIDSLNRTVISCSDDGKVKFWSFATGTLLHEIDWHPMVKILSLRYHPNSDLIALSCDDGSLRILDATTRKLVRELWATRSSPVITTIDYTFSSDGRWILSASSDSTPVNTVAFSPAGDFLATGLEGEVGVHIWTNRSLFTHVPTRQISDADVATVSAPTASGEGGENIIDAAGEESEDDDQEKGATAVPVMDQLSDKITTLSLVPKSRWQTLLHLDVIRARNKPKEAPKAPEHAPFFLPAVGEKSARTPLDADADAEAGSRISSSALASRSTAATSTSDFTRLLERAEQTAEHTPLLAYLASLPPSAADIALRTLDTTAPYTELRTFVAALTARLQQRRDYELLRTWQEESKRERDRVGGLVGYSAGVVGWVRSAR